MIRDEHARWVARELLRDGEFIDVFKKAFSPPEGVEIHEDVKNATVQLQAASMMRLLGREITPEERKRVGLALIDALVEGEDRARSLLAAPALVAEACALLEEAIAIAAMPAAWTARASRVLARAASEAVQPVDAEVRP